ncbi:hypothetical protein [Duganella fentianensis]|uniref:hypothetical protein n=1 Tax=Duganella fentianensis TaxID=2692177 RepID=UPI0032B22221
MKIRKTMVVLALGMTAACSVHAQAVLNAETNIEKNGNIATRSGHYSLVVQGDGNVAIYYNSPPATVPTGFQTNTNSGDHLRMQMDGNLALYKSNGTWAWNSGTGGHPYSMGYKLVLFETGRLAILDANNALVKEIAGVDAHANNGGFPVYYPFRKGSPCVDGLTPLMQDGVQATRWATANGGTIGYCGSPY